MAYGPTAHLPAPVAKDVWIIDGPEIRFRYGFLRIPFPTRTTVIRRKRMPEYSRIGPQPPAAWGDAIDQVVVDGSRITEAEFFHRPSRTLLITDLIENFENVRFNSAFYRFLSHIGGVIDPDGKAPLELRMSFSKNRAQLRAAVERMIAWCPARIVMAHGRWYERHAISELRRAFRWVL